jgi:sec-independent protein translocase protein TatA
MGFGSPLHWIIVIAVVVLLFGSGRVSTLMGDVAKGIKSFKKGMSEDEDAEERRRLTAERAVEARPVPPVEPAPAEPARAPDTDRQA